MSVTSAWGGCKLLIRIISFSPLRGSKSHVFGLLDLSSQIINLKLLFFITIFSSWEDEVITAQQSHFQDTWQDKCIFSCLIRRSLTQYTQWIVTMCTCLYSGPKMKQMFILFSLLKEKRQWSGECSKRLQVRLKPWLLILRKRAPVRRARNLTTKSNRRPETDDFDMNFIRKRKWNTSK